MKIRIEVFIILSILLHFGLIFIVNKKILKIYFSDYIYNYSNIPVKFVLIKNIKTEKNKELFDNDRINKTDSDKFNKKDNFKRNISFKNENILKKKDVIPEKKYITCNKKINKKNIVPSKKNPDLLKNIKKKGLNYNKIHRKSSILLKNNKDNNVKSNTTDKVFSKKSKDFINKKIIEYLKKVSEKVYKNRINPKLKGYINKTVIVEFVIFRDGRVKDIKIKNNSSLNIINESALKIIEKASPFDPIPDDIPQSFLNVKIPIRFFSKD